MLVMLLLLVQGARAERVFEKPISATHVVSLLKDSTPAKVTLHLRIEEKTDRSRFWELAALDDR